MGGCGNIRVHKFGTSKSPALVLASKFVHKEAHSVLYGCNRFVFENTTVFQEMMLKSARTVAHITDVEIVRAPSAPSLYTLEDANSLKRLHIQRIDHDGDVQKIASTIAAGVLDHLCRRREGCKCKRANEMCLCISEEDVRPLVKIVTVDLTGHKVRLGDGSWRVYGDERDAEFFQEELLDTMMWRIAGMKKTYERVHGKAWEH